MFKFIKKAFLILLLLGTSIWMVLAVYFGDSYTSTAQTVVAAILGLLGLLVIAGLWSQWRAHLLVVHGLLFATVYAWWSITVLPLNDRDWKPDVATIAHATIVGDKITVYNIRNADYRSEFDYKTAYYDKTFDLTKLKGIDVLASYWDNASPAIAHIWVSFNFGDKDFLSISIEARKETHESFSIIRGFFRQHELIYVVADERDVIGVRSNFRTNPTEEVHLFHLNVSPEITRKFFMEYIKKINFLYANPVFYNTLLDNCTTSIWFKTSIDPDNKLPFSWKIILSGFLPEYLYDVGLIDTSIPFAQLHAQSNVNAAAKAASREPDFSLRIREAIKQTH
jgi:phosphate/sulfate permease